MSTLLYLTKLGRKCVLLECIYANTADQNTIAYKFIGFNKALSPPAMNAATPTKLCFYGIAMETFLMVRHKPINLLYQYNLGDNYTDNSGNLKSPFF